MNDYTFGNFLYVLRTEKGLSQSELGKIIGVSNKAVSKWEMGISKPRPSKLLALADFFEVTVEELLSGKRTEKQSELTVSEEELCFAINVQIKAYRKARIRLIVSTVLFVLSMTSFILTLAISSVYDKLDSVFPLIAILIPLSNASLIGVIAFAISMARRKRLLYESFPKRADKLDLKTHLTNIPNTQSNFGDKKKKVLLIILSIILVMVIGTALSYGIILLDGCTGKIRTYHDIEIYTLQKYHDKDTFGEKVYHSGVGADYFLPKYEEIEYNYSDIDFYIFDGTATSSKTAVTFVLDLKFNDKTEYESAKQNELITRDFMTEYDGKKWYENPVVEFNIGNYFCKTVDGTGYPSRVRLICLNDNNYILRYLIFEEWESPEYVKDADYISSCTNCPWNK